MFAVKLSWLVMVKSRRELLQWKLSAVFVPCHPCPRISHRAMPGSDAVLTVGKFSWKVNLQWNKYFNTCSFQLEVFKGNFNGKSHWLSLLAHVYDGARKVSWVTVGLSQEMHYCRGEECKPTNHNWSINHNSEHCRKRVHKEHICSWFLPQIHMSPA